MTDTMLDRFIIDYELDFMENLDETLTAATAITARTWTPTDERKHKRDSRGRFARGAGGGVSAKAKLKRFLETDTGEGDELDPDIVAEVAGAFTGKFGNLRTGDVAVVPGPKPGTIKISGSVRDDRGDEVGLFTRMLRYRKSGDIEVEHVSLELDSDVQGQGFARAFNKRAFDWYRENDVTSVKLLADIDVGGYAWAVAGYDWLDDDPYGPAELLERINDARTTDFKPVALPDDKTPLELRGQRQLEHQLSLIPRERRDEQRRLAQRLFLDIDGTIDVDTDPDDVRDIIEMWPTPYEISQLGRWPGAGRNDWWIGKAIMAGSNWWGVLELVDDDA